jgi:hypothetical protein
LAFLEEAMMNRNLENAQGGFGMLNDNVEDDPYGGILQNEPLRRKFPADSFDVFWLRIGNR